jgi:hypothetical protein
MRARHWKRDTGLDTGKRRRGHQMRVSGTTVEWHTANKVPLIWDSSHKRPTIRTVDVVDRSYSWSYCLGPASGSGILFVPLGWAYLVVSLVSSTVTATDSVTLYLFTDVYLCSQMSFPFTVRPVSGLHSNGYEDEELFSNQIRLQTILRVGPLEAGERGWVLPQFLKWLSTDGPSDTGVTV